MEPFYREFIKREAVTGMILDVDGTLLDSMPVWHHSGEHYLATIGIQAPASLGRILFSMTMQQGAQYIRKTYRLSQSEEEIKAGIIKTVQHEYSTGPGMKPGAREFLQALKEAAIPMTVVTSTDRPLILAAFGRLGIESYFQDILTCTEFGSGKDAPDIFHAVAQGMGSRPEHTWVAEDALYAIRTAKAAGYPVIGIADQASRADEPQIRGLSDYFIQDFLEAYKGRFQKTQEEGI